jgi:hypothetical protein
MLVSFLELVYFVHFEVDEWWQPGNGIEEKRIGSSSSDVAEYEDNKFNGWKTVTLLTEPGDLTEGKNFHH